jgi:hypothetical protein
MSHTPNPRDPIDLEDLDLIDLRAYGSLLSGVLRDLGASRKEKEAEYIRKGSPPGPFPTLEQTTAALPKRTPAALPKQTTVALATQSSNSAVATAVTPSSTKITWATVAATSRKR